MSINKEYFREKLEAEKSILLEELNGIAINNPDNPNDWEAVVPDDNSGLEFRDDVADQLEDLSERKAEEVPLEKQLERVNAALERIGDDTYGQCAVCGKEIELERLEASPAATTCTLHLDQEA